MSAQEWDFAREEHAVNLVSRILAEETGKRADEIKGSTDRPPVRPVTFGELAEDGKEACDHE